MPARLRSTFPSLPTDPETALHWIEAAGDAAMKALASGEAEAHYRNALAVMEESPQPVQARLLEKLGNALRGTDWGSAEPYWRPAQELYGSFGNVPCVGRIAFQLTALKAYQISFDEAVREMQRKKSEARLRNEILESQHTLVRRAVRERQFRRGLWLLRNHTGLANRVHSVGCNLRDAGGRCWRSSGRNRLEMRE